MSQVIDVHRLAIRTDLKTMASTLVDVLGRTLVAGIVGVRNPKTITRWSQGDVTSIRDRFAEERILALFQVVALLQQQESKETIRAFMIGMNPELDDASPAIAIHNGDYRGAMDAAKNLITGSY